MCYKISCCFFANELFWENILISFNKHEISEQLVSDKLNTARNTKL